MIKKIIPSSIKLLIRRAQRNLNDKKTGIDKQFSTLENYPNNQLINYKKVIEQPIYYNPLSANKVINIRIAIAELSKYAIQPGSVFSLWQILGKPSPKKGYQTGRNIINGSLKEDIGGGLCQVAGMIYHLALETGMEIMERHNHTLDLYQENKRYTPLGADSSVVFGYKDLRFKNPFDTTIYLAFEVSQEVFKGEFSAQKEIPHASVRFERAEENKIRTIKTYRKIEDKPEEFLNLSTYKI